MILHVTRAQRVWGWVIAMSLAWVFLTWMTIEGRGDDTRLTREIRVLNSLP